MKGISHLNVGIWYINFQHRYVPMEAGTLGPYWIATSYYVWTLLATWPPCLGVSSLPVCQTLQPPSPAAHTMRVRKAHSGEKSTLVTP